jgi:hypothetical protein
MNSQQNLFLRSKIKFSLKNVTKPFSVIRLRAQHRRKAISVLFAIRAQNQACIF